MNVKQQIELMERLRPNLKLKFHDYWIACWEGWVPGADRQYLVRLRYFRWREFDHYEIKNRLIEVQVLEPALRVRQVAPEEPIPHLYRYTEPTRGYPLLCLYDPEAADWDRDQPIATTIVLWIAQWLVFYELWHATGIWYGKGRHPGDAVINENETCSQPANDDPQAPFKPGAPGYPGLTVDNSESSPLTAGGSAESSRPHFWPLSSRSFWMATVSPTTLISSWGLPPAES